MTELATPVAEEATIRQLVPFNELFGQQFHEALKCCELVTIPPRKKLFKRGQREPYDYYLLSGSVDLVDGEFNITSLRQGDPECRHALDNRPPHRYSAITTDTCELLKVDRQRLELAMTWGQAGDYSVLDAAEDEVDWMSALLESEVFTGIPPANIQRLFTAFKNTEKSLGEVVVAEGEQGDLFYVIEHGSALGTKQEGPKAVQLARLGPGDLFGEEALIGDTTRNATVTMETDGALMFLEKAEFKNLLEGPVLHRISESDLEAMAADDTELVLVDVRLSGEFRHFHRKQAVNIPLNKLRERSERLSRSATYVVVDNAGPRAELGAFLLIKAGLKTFLLQSGSVSE